ncbi:MAG: ribosome small subunit-dependent GTPase A [Eubacteriales bacterium]|jgi:ribosome biogenesis GTPase
MQGRIIRGIAGFYYVAVDGIIWTCKARGIFRKNRQKPLVGDFVTIEPTDEAAHEANVTSILERKNALIRPEAANVDQAMVFFALKNPDPDMTLLDRFLVSMEYQGVPVIICFNKSDLDGGGEARGWQDIYRECGYRVNLLSAKEGTGVEEVREQLIGRTTVVAGPSGAGKSTFANRLQSELHMETGELSEKLGRGKNTTRRAELLMVGPDTFFCDTPGFTSLDLPPMEPEELQGCFPEFAKYEPECRFTQCSHISEPDCGVKKALEEGLISRDRYDHYCLFYNELKELKKRRY